MPRIVCVRNALACRILELWYGQQPPPDGDEVLTPWVYRIDSDKIIGRKVMVFADAFSQVTANRRDDQNDYTYTIMVVERYTEQGDAPDEWIDERVKFCEELITKLGDARGEWLLSGGVQGLGLWPEIAEITTVYDAEELHERKLFVSVLSITYREEVAP